MHFIIKSVLELSVLQNALNSHVGFLHDGRFKMSSVFGVFIEKKKKR